MSQQSSDGDKTENATPKRLRDARKRGDVPKSKDVTSTLGLAFIVVLFWTLAELALKRMMRLFNDVVLALDMPFTDALSAVGSSAMNAFMVLSALILLPIAVFGLLAEFLQVGPLFSFDKISPKLEHLDPIAGVKRMFNIDNFVEIIKSLGKTAVLFILATLVIGSFLDELVFLPVNNAGSVLWIIRTMLIHLFGWTLVIFSLFMLMDASYQRYSYNKKLRMSMQDIKQEHKDSEGDPQVKGQRRQMHKEFSSSASDEAAKSATVLVVNPTHLAIAIKYDVEELPVPMVSAMGADDVARDMRQTANDSKVPVLRNELLARTLFSNVDEGDPVPADLFDIVAEVILWAQNVTQQLSQIDDLSELYIKDEREDGNTLEPPGEDLTHYPANKNPVRPSQPPQIASADE